VSKILSSLDIGYFSKRGSNINKQVNQFNFKYGLRASVTIKATRAEVGPKNALAYVTTR